MVVHLPPPYPSPPARHHPSNPPSQLGRLTHFAFDAVLVSAFLAGVKRSTGLTYVSKIQRRRAVVFFRPRIVLT